MNSVLELAATIRLRVDFPDGTYKSERHFLDFIVDGHSLWEILGKRHDMVSVLCREYVLDETTKALAELLLQRKSEIPNDRRRLFICSECGDLGCGAITVAISKEDSAITWKDFGYENSYENEVHSKDYGDMGPFRFDRSEYETTLQQALDWLRA